jgi:inorganic pyrophosphatase
MGILKVSTGINPPDDINVVIEIPAHSGPIKYEVDKETGILSVDRFLSTSMEYPCDYGYIPDTLSEDGDPVDVLVITPIPVSLGCVIRCRPVGMLSMSDEAGNDRKILAVPVDKLTSLYKDVKKVEDLPESLIKKITHFFLHYKDLEEGKWVKLDGWLGLKEAQAEIMDGIKRYQQA